MIKSFFIISIFILCQATPLFSQTDSPVGTWYLKTNHTKFELKDLIHDGSNTLTDTLITKIVFKPNGKFLHKFGSVTLKGKWRLSKKRNRFVVRYANHSKVILLYRNGDRINFEDPLELPKGFKADYDPNTDGEYMEMGKYIREPYKRDTAFTNKMVGKWTICTSRTFSSSEDCSRNPGRTYDFKADGTYTTDREYVSMGKKYASYGVWKMIDENTLVKFRDFENKGYRYPVQLRLTWVNDSLAYIKGIEGLKRGPTVYTFFKKL